MKKQQRNRLIVAAVLTVLCALLALVPFTGLEAQGKGVLIVFVWAILMWIVRPIPEYLIGVLAAAVLAIFFGMKTNVVSGFSSSGWWLCLWAGFIGSAIKFSGLGERVAYWILVKMGKTELMANYATSIANTVLSLMIPSNTARGAVMSPICDNICEGMGYKRGEHKGDAAIMLSNLFTNTTNTWLFYTAVGANAIGMALVTEVTGQEISWTGWLQATFIPAGITLLLIPILCHLLFGAKKGEKREIDITFAKEKPIITWEHVEQNLMWGMFFLFAGGTAFGALVNGSGASEVFAGLIARFPVHNTFLLVLIIVTLNVVLSDVINNTACAAVTIPIVIGIAQGLSLPVIPYLWVATVSYNLSYTLPTSIRSIPIGYGLSPRYMFVRGIVLTVVMVLAVSVIGWALITFWPGFSVLTNVG